MPDLLVDNAELMAALAQLQGRLASSVGPEHERLCDGARAMNANSPDWVTHWPDWTNMTVHFVPGPKLVDLLLPIERLELPKPSTIRGSRWRSVMRHLKAAWEAARG